MSTRLRALQRAPLFVPGLMFLLALVVLPIILVVIGVITGYIVGAFA